MSEVYEETYSNYQDDPSEIIGDFPADPGVPHSGSKLQFSNLEPHCANKTQAEDTSVDYIYWRDDEQNAAVGIVEIVATQEEKPFRSLEELLIILNTAEVGAVIKWQR